MVWFWVHHRAADVVLLPVVELPARQEQKTGLCALCVLENEPRAGAAAPCEIFLY